jgi:uncharacterized protein YqeY
MLRVDLNEALKQSQKARDKQSVATLRLILAALKDRDIAARSHGNCDGVGEDEILDMLQKMVRQRREAIEMYDKGGRPDLVAKEQAEIAVIERFMPRQMNESEIRSAVDQTIAEVVAKGIKDMGRVMADLKSRYSGRMDFGKASALVKGALT